MALSDCVKCWETPCICGYEYSRKEYWSLAKLKELRNALDKEIIKRENQTEISGK
jgi:hypothetical protein